MRFNRLTITSLAAAGAVLAGGGAALATDGDKTSRCETFMAKVAEKRGVSVEQLEANVKAKVIARIDAAEKAGRLTAEEAAAKRSRVAEATACKLVAKNVKRVKKARGAKRAGVGAFAGAAAYLGLSPAELKAQLKAGRSLADLVPSGKSVDGLKAAMLKQAQERLATFKARVAASERLSDERKAKILERIDAFEARLPGLVDKLVERHFTTAKVA